MDIAFPHKLVAVQDMINAELVLVNVSTEGSESNGSSNISSYWGLGLLTLDHHWYSSIAETSLLKPPSEATSGDHGHIVWVPQILINLQTIGINSPGENDFTDNGFYPIIYC